MLRISRWFRGKIEVRKDEILNCWVNLIKKGYNTVYLSDLNQPQRAKKPTLEMNLMMKIIEY